jgi:predicted amidophosphoribosyltransferase
MQFLCPHCQAPIYSRKHKICGVCEKPLPEALLLNGGQIAFLKKQDEQIEKRAKEFHFPDPAYGSDVDGMV